MDTTRPRMRQASENEGLTALLGADDGFEPATLTLAR